MGVVNAKAVFAAARRVANDEREHPHWSCALRDLRRLCAYAEALVGPHPGVLPSLKTEKGRNEFRQWPRNTDPTRKH